MKVHYRRLLWVAFFITLLILFAIAVGYSVRNFTGIGPVPVRSAFAGRLPSIPDGNLRRFQFFYATNRANNDDTFNGQGNMLGDGILTGTFDVLISPYMSIKPFVWFETKNIAWADRHELAQDKFLFAVAPGSASIPAKISIGHRLGL